MFKSFKEWYTNKYEKPITLPLTDEWYKENNLIEIINCYKCEKPIKIITSFIDENNNFYCKDCMKKQSIYLNFEQIFSASFPGERIPKIKTQQWYNSHKLPFSCKCSKCQATVPLDQIKINLDGVPFCNNCSS